MPKHIHAHKRATGSLAACAVAASLLVSCQSDATFDDAAVALGIRAAREVDPAQLRQHITKLLDERQLETPELATYYYKQPLRRVRSGDYVDAALRTYGYTPVREIEDANDFQTQNIYIDVPGRELPQEQVLLTGHYDNWHLGADDNASAVAVLLEAARVLRDKPLRRTVRIVAFDREEVGLMGSDRYARLHAGEHITALLNMDCVGFASREPGSQSAPPGLALRSMGDFLTIIASDPAAPMLSSVIKLSRQLPQSVSVLGLVAPGDGHNAAGAAFLRSDHAPFWQRGVPALFLTDTANYRNPNYHKMTDLPQTLDYDFLAKNAQLIVAAVVALAEEG